MLKVERAVKVRSKYQVRVGLDLFRLSGMGTAASSTPVLSRSTLPLMLCFSPALAQCTMGTLPSAPFADGEVC